MMNSSTLDITKWLGTILLLVLEKNEGVLELVSNFPAIRSNITFKGIYPRVQSNFSIIVSRNSHFSRDLSTGHSIKMAG